MPRTLNISWSSVALDSGSPEERAGFGIIKLATAESILTEGFDHHVNTPREGPLVSGYHLAEWLAWNWWRMRWEWWHAANATDEVVCGWDFAHRMSTIGEGYEWPNIAIASDGFQTALVSDPSYDDQEISFRYSGAPLALISATALEAAVDRFVSCILERMDGDGLRGTNLHRLWNELEIERREQDTALFRRLEARLGYDPDEADQSQSNHGWLTDAEQLGRDALEELAADASYRGARTDMMSADQITEMAGSCGFDAAPEDSVKLSPSATNHVEWGEVEAWRIGEDYARRLHLQEKMDAEKPISNERLADLAGVTKDAISTVTRAGKMSFAFDRNGSGARMVLGSTWQTGRRFALARIIGDRLSGWTDKMFPATQSYSYRQKAQRSFAAELLSPFKAVNDMLGTDDSADRQNEIAKHYNVSYRAIESMLVNKGRIRREDASGIVHQQFLVATQSDA